MSLSKTDQHLVRSELAAGLLQRFAGAQNDTDLDISRRSYATSLTLVLALAAALQTGMLLDGYYSLSADESARALLAHKLTWTNAFDPFIWPPLGPILNALALTLHNDLLITPRLLASGVGLLALLGVGFLAYALFGNRLISVTSAGLAVLVPQRLLLSVAPLSDIFSTTFLIYAMGFVVLWLRNGRTKELTIGSVFLLLAAMTRYELWFFNAVLALYLAYRTFIRRDLSFAQLVLNGAILSIFPIFWVLHVHAHEGNFDIFRQTSRQFIYVHGRDYAAALCGNVFARLAQDFLFNPILIVGACLMGFLGFHAAALRHWLILILAPFVILGAEMAITLGVPMAAPFRIDGIWVLLILPFAAFALVFAAEKITSDKSQKYAVLALSAAVAVVPFGFRSQMLAQGMRYPVALDRNDIALGKYLRTRVAADSRNILVDAVSSLDFLNVPVAANIPDRIILDVDEDPLKVANYVDERKAYEAQHNKAILDRYLTDKFALADVLDRPALKARKIGHIVVQNPGFIKALDADPYVTHVASFGLWVVYDLKD